MREQFFNVHKLRLHATLWEHPTSAMPPLIMIHGGWDDRHMIADLASRLAAKRPVYVLELRGHGLSDKPISGYRLEDFAGDIQEVIAQIPYAQVDVFGHSLGAVVGLIIALNVPNKIAHLVMEDPPFILSHEEAGYRARMGQLLSLKHQPPETVQTTFDKMFSRWEPKLREIAIQSFQNTADGFFRAQSVGGEQPIVHWPPLLSHLIVPTLALAGDAARGGWLTGPRKEMFTEAASTVRLIEFPNCGHYIHLEQPEGVAQIIEGFLEE